VTREEFDKKYELFLDVKQSKNEIDISSEEDIFKVDEIFTLLVQIPGFMYTKVSKKPDGTIRLHTNLGSYINYKIENKINNIITER
jgi:hypothetical protein